MSDVIARLNEALSGRYIIEGELGEGGMARVYLARDEKHNRHVALKVLKPELAAVVGAERFLAEIETTAMLQHPHILPLFDSGDVEGFLFYVMPYVEGETLRDRLERDRELPVDEAVAIATNLAEALDYAHRQGVIHRDIKPGNVLLKEGKPVISDFGIALAVGTAGGGRLTDTGLSVGSPSYMSPEQATGDHNVGPPTDVYALGCVLYEMLVGEPPFIGSSARAVLGRIITTEAPSVRAQRKAVPPNVDAVIRRSLEKLPADRFSSAQGFAHALSVPGFRHGDVHPEAKRRPLAAIVGGALGGGAIVTAFLTALGVGSAGSGIEFGAIRKVTFDPGLEILPAISPDGREVAYVSAASAFSPGRLTVRGLAGGRPAEVSDERLGGEEYPRWSPDGSTLFFHAAGRVFEVPARGGTPRPLTREGGTTTASYGVPSPDGNRLAYIRTEGDHATISVISDEGRTVVAEVAPTSHSLVWSPDGRWLAFTEGNPPWVQLEVAFANVAPSAVKVVPADGGEPVEVAPSQYLNVSPAFLPDGRLLFISGRGGVRDIYMIELGPDGAPERAPIRLTAGLQPHTMSISSDGRRLAYTTLVRRQNVHVLEIPESDPVSAYTGAPVTAGQQVVEGIAVSPDGEWVAFDSDRSGTQDVFRQRLDGRGSVQLTSLPSDQFVRSWSDDARFIAGHGFNERVRDIFVADADGVSYTYIAPNPAHDRYPDFSPNGDRIAFESERVEPGIYVTARLSDGTWTLPERAAPGRRPRWSPDGSMILSVDTDRSVWVTSPGNPPELLHFESELGSIRGAEWDEGGDRLLLLRQGTDATHDLFSYALSTGATIELIHFDNPARQPRHEMAVHDGRLYYTLGEFESDVWVMELEFR